jgi:hypothetical protein
MSNADHRGHPTPIPLTSSTTPTLHHVVPRGLWGIHGFGDPRSEEHPHADC